MTRFDVARTQQPKSTVAYGSLRFGLLRHQLKRTIGMVHKPDNSECSRQVWFERKKLDLSNGKHIDQNWSTLKTYVFPHIGRIRLDQIKQRHIIDMFEPVRRLRHETAHCASEPDQK